MGSWGLVGQLDAVRPKHVARHRPFSVRKVSATSLDERIRNVPEKEVVISDLTCCQPNEALTPADTPREGCWRVVDYETEDGIAGKMLFAAPAPSQE